MPNINVYIIYTHIPCYYTVYLSYILLRAPYIVQRCPIVPLRSFHSQYKLYYKATYFYVSLTNIQRTQ